LSDGVRLATMIGHAYTLGRKRLVVLAQIQRAWTGTSILSAQETDGIEILGICRGLVNWKGSPEVAQGTQREWQVAALPQAPGAARPQPAVVMPC